MLELFFQVLHDTNAPIQLRAAPDDPLVSVGGAGLGGLVRGRRHEVHPLPELHLAGQQRSAHLGQQALR